jgi:hypothetical protein
VGSCQCQGKAGSCLDGFKSAQLTGKRAAELRRVLGANGHPPSSLHRIHPGNGAFPAPADSGANRPYSVSALSNRFARRSVSCHVEVPSNSEARRRISSLICFVDNLLHSPGGRSARWTARWVASQFGKAEPLRREVVSKCAVIQPESVTSVTEVRNFPEADFGRVRADLSAYGVFRTWGSLCSLKW